MAGKKTYSGKNPFKKPPVSIVLGTFNNFGSSGGSNAAASLAYYALFSLFPLLALLVGLIGYIVPSNQIEDVLLRFLTPVFPASGSLITENVARLVLARGTISIIGLVGFTWSASNVFNTLIGQIDRAWGIDKQRAFWLQRLVALALVLGAVVLMAILFFLGGLLDLVSHSPEFSSEAKALVNSIFLQIAAQAFAMVVMFIIFLVLYRFVPGVRVRWGEALWGALFVTVIWEITARGFSFYVNSPLVNYTNLYGSLATIAVLMLWFYLNSLILLVGAYLSAEIARQTREEQPEGEPVNEVTGRNQGGNL